MRAETDSEIFRPNQTSKHFDVLHFLLPKNPAFPADLPPSTAHPASSLTLQWVKIIKQSFEEGNRSDYESKLKNE